MECDPGMFHNKTNIHRPSEDQSDDKGTGRRLAVVGAASIARLVDNDTIPTVQLKVYKVVLVAGVLYLSECWTWTKMSE